MIVSAPLKNLDFGAWLTQLRANGVKPEQAMAVYKDLRMFGAVVFRLGTDSASEEWDAFRSTLCEKLVALQTAEDIDAHHTRPFPHDEKISTTKKLAANRFSEEGMGGVDNIVQWVVEQGQRPRSDIAVSWEDVFSAMQHDIPSVEELGESGGGDIALLEQVESTMANAGLQSLEWPALVGLAPKTASRIVAHVAQTNLELRSRTKWEGGVLGLNGTVALRIGGDRSGSGGYCNGNADTTIFVCSSPATPFSVLAHEWFHALDFKLGGADTMLSHKDSGTSHEKQHIDELVAQLNSYSPSFSTPVEQTDFMAGLRQNLEQKWTNAGYPDGIGGVLEEMLQKGQSLDAADTYTKNFGALKNFLDTNGFARNTDLHATILMADIATVRDSEQLLNSGKSLWIAFAERFRQNINTHLKKHKGYADYYFEASEQLAHSFEVTSDGHKVSFINPQQNMRYPTQPEQMAQKIHWRRFFEAIKPWWNAQTKAEVNAPLSFSERVKKKRDPQGTAVAPSLPLAAKT